MHAKIGEHVLNLDQVTHTHFNPRSECATVYFTDGQQVVLDLEETKALNYVYDKIASDVPSGTTPEKGKAKK